LWGSEGSHLSGPPSIKWDYDRSEIVAHGIVHGLGIVLAPVAVAVLIWLAAEKAGPWEFGAVVLYGGALVAVLSVSALYNLWPISDTKWTLRRYDHAAIYLLIAGTYTPFVSQMSGGLEVPLLFTGVWATSLAGAALKLLFPGEFERLSIALYLISGWSGALVYEKVSGLPVSTVQPLIIGGILYTVGVGFHLWRSLRFQNAIWHAFVLAASACHYLAVLNCIMLTNT
jgi:hemolysin III